MNEINDVGQVSEGVVKRPVLAIKENNCATNDPCAVCGVRTDPDTGPELFLEGTWGLVCHECGQKYAPQLTALLALHHSNQSDALEDSLIDKAVLDAIKKHADERGIYPFVIKWLAEDLDMGQGDTRASLNRLLHNGVIFATTPEAMKPYWNEQTPFDCVVSLMHQAETHKDNAA